MDRRDCPVYFIPFKSRLFMLKKLLVLYHEFNLLLYHETLTQQCAILGGLLKFKILECVFIIKTRFYSNKLALGFM